MNAPDFTEKLIFRLTCHEITNRTFSGPFTKLLLYEKRAFLSPIALPHGVLYDRSLVLCLLLFQDFRVYSRKILSKTLFTQTHCFLSIPCSPTVIIVDSHIFPMVFQHARIQRGRGDAAHPWRAAEEPQARGAGKPRPRAAGKPQAGKKTARVVAVSFSPKRKHGFFAAPVWGPEIDAKPANAEM